MKILSIETSCDESSVAIIDINTEKKQKMPFSVLSHLISSQASIHANYGGVFPMMAKREHSKNLVPLLLKAFKEAGIIEEENNIPFNNSALTQDFKNLNNNSNNDSVLNMLNDVLSREPEMKDWILNSGLLYNEKVSESIDAIAVTNGPGLEPALWVGLNLAKLLASFWKVPLIPINHMEGHIFASLVEASPTNGSNNMNFEFKDISFPSIALLISGGHTELVKINKIGDYEIIGSTKDDAVGEAYDKVARLLSLPYPGGPHISELSEKRMEISGNKPPKYPLPRPMINSKDCNFSFSGLKTAVLYTLKKIKELSRGELTENDKMEIAWEFENSVSNILISKTNEAIKEFQVNDLIIGGGVIANRRLQRDFNKYCIENGISLHLPKEGMSGDNALMIGLVCAVKISINLDLLKNSENTLLNLRADGNLSF